jgi:hypothetical protein
MNRKSLIFLMLITQILLLNGCSERDSHHRTNPSINTKKDSCNSINYKLGLRNLILDCEGQNLLKYKRYIINYDKDTVLNEWIDLGGNLSLNSINYIKETLTDSTISFQYLRNIHFDKLLLLTNLDGEIRGIKEINKDFNISLDSFNLKEFVVFEIISLNKREFDSTLSSSSFYKAFELSENNLREAKVDLRKMRHNFSVQKYDYFYRYYIEWFQGGYLHSRDNRSEAELTD